MVLSIFTELCIYCHYLIPELFHHSKKELHIPLEVTPYLPFFQSRPTTDLLSVSMELLGQHFAL